MISSTISSISSNFMLLITECSVTPRVFDKSGNDIIRKFPIYYTQRLCNVIYHEILHLVAL